MPSQSDKARRFHELHASPRVLVMPNPWDAGSTKLLSSLGFDALAATSLGLANMLVLCNGEGAVSREAVLETRRVICAAIDRPVSADQENGEADEPRAAARMVTDGDAAGLVVSSI